MKGLVFVVSFDFDDNGDVGREDEFESKWFELSFGCGLVLVMGNCIFYNCVRYVCWNKEVSKIC